MAVAAVLAVLFPPWERRPGDVLSDPWLRFALVVACALYLLATFLVRVLRRQQAAL